MGAITYTNETFSLPVKGPGSELVQKEKAKQAAPIDRSLILRYRLAKASVTSGKVTGRITYWSPNSDGYGTHFDVNNGGGTCVCGTSTYQDGGGMPRTRQIERAVNLAREKFTGKMQDQAMLAVNFYERQQALAMMAKRFDFLEKSTKEIFRLATSSAWRRGELLNLRRMLQEGILLAKRSRKTHTTGAKQVASQMIQKIKDWRGSGKTLGNLWLELHFGWEPLLKDIYAAYELLAEAPKPLFYKCRSRELFIEESFRYTYGTIGGIWHGFTFEPKTRTRASVFGKIEVIDPNLYKTQRLGLLNPAAFAWEIIPFSFVVDWFANVSQWLNQWDEFMGIKLSSVGYSVLVRQTAKGSWTEKSGKAVANSQMMYYQRFDTLPNVKLGLRPLKGLSVVRGATAISLLLQQLKNPVVSQKQPLRSL